MEIQEPVDWSDVTIDITRDMNWHGVFFGYTFNSLQFVGQGAEVIKEEWEMYGFNGDMGLRVYFQCSEDSEFDLFYTGRLRFPEYKDTCGVECSVIIGLEDTTDVMLLRNNYEQQVNLLSNKAFDQTTVLQDYPGLNFNIEVPARGLLQISEGKNEQNSSFDLLIYSPWGNISPAGTTGTVQGNILPYFTVQPKVDINSTDLPTGPNFDPNGRIGDPNIPPPNAFIYINPQGDLKCVSNSVKMRLRVKGSLVDSTFASRVVALTLNVYAGPSQSDGAFVYQQNLVGYESSQVTHINTFDYSADLTISVQPSYIVWVYMFITYIKTSSASMQQLTFGIDKETEVSFSTVNSCEETESKVFMINEAASRVVESITNNRIKFYSETFGRIDSQPYAIANNPCPGLFAITNGLNIRRKMLSDGTQPGQFISLKQLFDQQKSLWNIGMDVEPDVNRPGYNRLRFEDWKYFYQNGVGIWFNPAKIDRSADNSRAYNKLTVGYNKWQANETTGLDEYMTKRTYRIGINSITNELSLSTDIICSPYTIEITRRQDKTTADYQYDNDSFGFCLTFDSPGNYHVTQFSENASGYENIIDPSTSYNALISPSRLAMRWFSYVIQALRQLRSDSKLIFSSGEANYIAKYATNACSIEGGVIGESDDIEIVDFVNLDDAKPITFPELITFDHPLNYNLFKKIKSESTLRRKEVGIRCNGREVTGWIKSITYKPNTGDATIVVIPKNDIQLPAPPEPEPCNTSVVDIEVVIDANNNAIVDFTDSTPGAAYWEYVLNKDGATVLSGATTSHPFTINALIPGSYQLIVIPYCDNGEVGIYGVQTFEVPAPQLTILLYMSWYGPFQPGGNKTAVIHATPVGGIFNQNISFKFGQCYSGGFCNGFPGTINPNPVPPDGHISAVNGQNIESSSKAYGDTSSTGSLLSVTIYDIISEYAVIIQKGANETWTLNQL
ncbi:hypothetical protein [Chitinophaga nivalis]|uniref:Uncharacterized protein n=1 Tax=Chitinophaga nivalis TaxID=2991709 RepID=A0ABT3IIK9_9BACT|nr:hypothetical protein [Chitinophaga nivalis]MCW3466507.1 hypothetical protein [Chitinophaga nivalis]MCW3483802.1 hypothetical protein [Chitinophaga nivalis]